MAELKTLLFDLDGTLVRTREASWELFRKTNEKFGLGVDTPSAFFRLFNQNFYAALDEKSGRLAENGAARAEAEAVKRHFQELLRQDYHPDLVPGMANVVHALAGQYTLIVLSSNTMEAVRRILLNCDVAHCFAHVFSGDVTPSKVDAIERFLADPSYSCGRRCSPHYEESTPQRLHDPKEAMLITDTVGDVEEAVAAGIRVGAVSWGMHRAEDLEAAGAEFVCIWPEELVAYLKPGETCSLGVCSLPTVHAAPQQPPTPTPTQQPPTPTQHTPTPTPTPTQTPTQTPTKAPVAPQRLRRQQAAAQLAASLAEPACDCGESCCAPATTADALLRQVLTVIGSQVSAERLSTRTEEPALTTHQELASMAAPNGGRVQPHKEDR